MRLWKPVAAMVSLMFFSACGSDPVGVNGAAPGVGSPGSGDQGGVVPAPGTQTPGTGDGTGQTPEPNVTAAPGAGEAVDVVLVVAVGDETPALVNMQNDFLRRLVESIPAKLAGRDARVAVIASQTAVLSGVKIDAQALRGFSPASVRQANFELGAKDVHLGALVTGCAANSNDLNSDHNAGNIKLCGRSVPVPAHSWTWAVEDLNGRFHGFLRPGAKRVYILVTSADASVVAPAMFNEIAKAQNAGRAPVVIAVAPFAVTAPCNSRNLRASNVGESVRRAGGKALPYCASDWSPALNDILSSL